MFTSLFYNIEKLENFFQCVLVLFLFKMFLNGSSYIGEIKEISLTFTELTYILTFQLLVLNFKDRSYGNNISQIFWDSPNLNSFILFRKATF